jgi:hypothetical protein
MGYIAIEFKTGSELKTENTLDAQGFIKSKFPNNKVFSVPVCAFGIVHTFYIDNEVYENYQDWKMENECGIIIYDDEDNRETRQRVERARKNYIPSKVL